MPARLIALPSRRVATARPISALPSAARPISVRRSPFADLRTSALPTQILRPRTYVRPLCALRQLLIS